MIGFHDVRVTDKQFPVVKLLYLALKLLLNIPAEMSAIDHIDPTVHEPETVRGTNNRIDVEIQNIATMNLHAVQFATVGLPSISKRFVDGTKDYFH